MSVCVRVGTRLYELSDIALSKFVKLYFLALYQNLSFNYLYSFSLFT